MILIKETLYDCTPVISNNTTSPANNRMLAGLSLHSHLNLAESSIDYALATAVAPSRASRPSGVVRCKEPII